MRGARRWAVPVGGASRAGGCAVRTRWLVGCKQRGTEAAPHGTPMSGLGREAGAELRHKARDRSPCERRSGVGGDLPSPGPESRGTGRTSASLSGPPRLELEVTAEAIDESGGGVGGGHPWTENSQENAHVCRGHSQGMSPAGGPQPKTVCPCLRVTVSQGGTSSKEPFGIPRILLPRFPAELNSTCTQPANSHGIPVPCPPFTQTLGLGPERLGLQGTEFPTAPPVLAVAGPPCRQQRQRVGYATTHVPLEAGSCVVTLCHTHSSHRVWAAEIKQELTVPRAPESSGGPVHPTSVGRVASSVFARRWGWAPGRD